MNALNETGLKPTTKSMVAKLEEIEHQAKESKIQWSPKPIIESFENHCNVEKINFKITFAEPVSEQTVIEGLGLTLKIKNTNMVAFNSENMIKRYETLKEIIDEWFDVRYDTYERRRVVLPATPGTPTTWHSSRHVSRAQQPPSSRSVISCRK